MQMDRDLHRRLQSAYEMIGIEGGQQAGHVLDAERVSADILQLFGEIDVPVDVVDWADRITDRGFRMFAAGLYLADRSIHVPYVVECIEDAEYVDAVRGGALDEPLQHVVGIVPIADEVLSAQ